MRALYSALCLFFCGAIYGEIKEIHQLKDIESLISTRLTNTQCAEKTCVLEGILETGQVAAIEWASQSMPEGSLIVFDVGNVLLAHKDAVLNYKHRSWVNEWFDCQAPEVDEGAWRTLSGVISSQAKMDLVNDVFPTIINQAKQKGPVIALSKFWCGPSGKENSFEEHRLALLKNVGIDFGEPFPHAAGWKHPELEATYSNGLIHTEASLKGPVLEEFLKHLAWTPKAILFVDDNKSQCENILATTKALGIPTLCIHYTESTDSTPHLNPAVADVQLRTLVSEHCWVSDEAVMTK